MERNRPPQSGRGLRVLRETFARGLVIMLWCTVLLVMALSGVALSGAVEGTGAEGTGASVVVVALALLLGTVATAVWMRDGSGPRTRFATALAFAGLVGLLLAGPGPAGALRAEAPLVFLAPLALLAGWLDWRVPPVFAAGAIAALLLLCIAMAPDDPVRFAAHVALLALAAGALAWTNRRVGTVLAGAAGDRRRLGALRTETARLAGLRELAATLDDGTGESLAIAGATGVRARATLETVHSLATATADLETAIAGIGERAARASRIADQASAGARVSGERVTRLAETALRIGDVVTLIQAIAERTNLLALNAAIEAARAGQAGKGFAVVAAQVKELAARTAKATGEIADQIAAIRTETGLAVDSIREIAGTIREVTDHVATVARAMSEQGAATGEIARGVARAASGARAVADGIDGLSRSVDRTAAAAGTLRSAAGDIARQGDMIRSRVGRADACPRA